jgi:hypothetical protein
MKILLGLLLWSPAAALAQGPFDGTWIIDSSTTQLPKKPTIYTVAEDRFRCSGSCIGNAEVKADGQEHKIAESAYWDTETVRIVDAYTIEIITKKAGKTLFTETDTVSPDGGTLTQLVKDTTEAEAVTMETLNKRVGQWPAGDHVVSGAWQAYKVSRSKNGSIITYKCTADGFSTETPLSEKFHAKFDGKDYLVEDDPAHTMVSVKRLSHNTVEQTDKRDGKIIGVLRLTVAADGKTIHATYENKEEDTTKSFDMRKQPQ